MPVEGPIRHGNGAGFELIETMRWEPQGGFLRGERHLARLRASAKALGFDWDPQDAIAKAEEIVAGSEVPLRVRLALSRDGTIAAKSEIYVPLPNGAVWWLKLARTRLQSADPLLRHKTSRRDAYTQARSEYGRDQADEVLLANERDELCEGTITSLFADFGEKALLTPALSCGLLAGVLRAEMIDNGAAKEAVFSYDDLRSARAVFVGNSLRGLIPAKPAWD
ncbi:MAG: aminotransferase class IV family protein [Rhizobiaceae bacterium]